MDEVLRFTSSNSHNHHNSNDNRSSMKMLRWWTKRQRVAKEGRSSKNMTVQKEMSSGSSKSRTMLARKGLLDDQRGVVLEID